MNDFNYFNSRGPVTYQTPVQPINGHPGPGQPPWAEHFRTATAHRRKSRVPLAVLWLLLVVGFIVLLGIGIAAIAASGGSGGTGTVTVTTGQGFASTQPSPAAAKMPVYKLGTPIRGGDFTFTLHSKKCGIAQVGTEFLSKKAQGSYCRLDVTAANVTRSPHWFIPDGSITVTDTKGRTFSVDGEAGVYGNKDGRGFVNEINPGNSVRAFIYFDVSSGVKLSSVTFDAGLFTTARDLTIPLA